MKKDVVKLNKDDEGVGTIYSLYFNGVLTRLYEKGVNAEDIQDALLDTKKVLFGFKDLIDENEIVAHANKSKEDFKNYMDFI